MTEIVFHGDAPSGSFVFRPLAWVRFTIHPKGTAGDIDLPGEMYAAATAASQTVVRQSPVSTLQKFSAQNVERT